MHPCVYRGVLCKVRGVKKERGRDRRVQCLGVVVEVVRVLCKEGGPRIRGKEKKSSTAASPTAHGFF